MDWDEFTERSLHALFTVTLDFGSVFTGNATAIRFYERRGYIFSHRAASFYGRGTDALVYHKELPPISIGQRV